MNLKTSVAVSRWLVGKAKDSLFGGSITLIGGEDFNSYQYERILVPKSTSIPASAVTFPDESVKSIYLISNQPVTVEVHLSKDVSFGSDKLDMTLQENNIATFSFTKIYIKSVAFTRLDDVEYSNTPVVTLLAIKV